ncbi:MAG: pyridoxamine 5'-phosphate oxidase family protein [Acholeplasmatales bacterium]|nr:pyridoxamine 5'-phosphate oxidase family protein [Acholeplasmatales bacterium]
MTNLEKTYKFLDETGCYFLATVENNQPRVRAFGTILCDGKKLYIQTGKSKPVAKQIYANPKVEICACKGSEWIRIACVLKEADDRALRVKMLEKMPSLRAMYNEDDGNMVLFELDNATVTFSSFTAADETFTL